MKTPPKFVFKLNVSNCDESTEKQIQSLRDVLDKCLEKDSWELSVTKHILVIDDEPSVRDAFEIALTSIGYQVECAVDGLSGVEAASRFRPDMVFIDLKMPGMDGMETLRHLLAQYETPPPVCIITSFTREFSEPLQQARTERLPFQLASKPLSPHQIRQIAQSLVGVAA